MATLREQVSRVRSLFKITDSDSIISDRAIASELRSTAIKYIKRETNLRRLWSSPNIFTNIECIDLEEAPLAECIDFQSDCMLRRSKVKIPKISEGIYGLLVQGVYSIDKRTKFLESTPTRYANTLRLQIRQKDRYFWIYNDYLYISDPNIEKVTLSAYFEDEVPIELLGCCQDCPQFPLDEPFKVPGYLEIDVVSTVAQVLLQTYKRSVPDNTSDNKDDSQ